jgi:hypothetical protein
MALLILPHLEHRGKPLELDFSSGGGGTAASFPPWGVA